MINIKEVSYKNKDFQGLCKEIDVFQCELIENRKNWGFSSLDGIDKLERILLIYEEETPISSVALRKVDNTCAEVTSVCTKKQYRNKGFSTLLIKEIINYAKVNDYKKLIIYTLKSSDAAIHLYKKLGFKEVSIYNKTVDKDHMTYIDNDILDEIDKHTVYMELSI